MSCELFLLIFVFGISQSCNLIDCPMPCSCTVKNSELFVDCSATGLDNTPSTVPTCDSVSSLHLNMSYNTMHVLYIHKYASYSILLDASSNRINQIKMDQDLDIEELNLENNSLEKLDKTFWKLFYECESVGLRGNPWKCDCDIYWLNKMLKETTNTKINHIEDIKCDKPSDKTDQKLKDVALDCPHEEGMPPGHIAAIVVCIFLYLSISSVIGLHIIMRRRLPVTSSE